MLYNGVAERWINIGLFFFIEKYIIIQVRMVTWVKKKEETIKSLSPKAYGLKLSNGL